MRPLASFGLAALALGLAAGPALAQSIGRADAAIGQEAVVPFYAQDGGAIDYRIDGSRGVWVLANNGKWYYLHVQPDCPRLAQTQSFGVNTGPQGQLDRFSTITAAGDRCLLRSVTRSAPPPHYNQPHHRHD